MGLVFKMYSNESKGERFPPVWLADDTPSFPCTTFTDDASIQSTPSDGTVNVFEVMPNLFAIYPEYLTDPAVMVCPSDATLTTDAWTTGQGASYFHKICSEDDDTGARAAQDSYLYFGYVIDKCDTGDPVLGTLCGQAVGWQSELQGNQGTGIGDDDIADSDLTPNWTNLGFSQPLGNGDGDTIYRLREGIERFLITDINNPAASARAQSDIFIYFDTISTKVEDYNHLPGGSNVLYLDGHVDFLRYEQNGAAPVNGITAEGIDAGGVG
jgi:prepilin-type processing-associated H-X9-DG protein